MDTPPTADATNKPPENTPRNCPSEAAAVRRGYPLRHWSFEWPVTVHDHPAYAVCQRIRAMLDEKGGSLIVLAGPRGTGKTQIAVSATKYLPAWQSDFKAPIYRKASDIFRELRGAYRKESLVSEMDVFAQFIKPTVLVIDEAQERGETPFEDRSLTHIIDKRYDAMLHTIIISNLTKEALAKSLGASIVSRAHEIGELIECNWPSFREKK